MREREAVPHPTPAPPTTQIINATEARQTFSQLLTSVYRSKRRVVVEKSGIPVAAIVSPEELGRLERLDTERAAAFRLIDRIRERNAGADPEQVYADVTTEVEAVRQELYERDQASQSGR